MGGHSFSLPKKQGIAFTGKNQIPETLQSSGFHPRAGKHTAHGAAVPVVSLQALLQIEKTAALSHRWHAARNRIADALPHTGVRGKLLCKKLRIPAAEINSVRT